MIGAINAHYSIMRSTRSVANGARSTDFASLLPGAPETREALPRKTAAPEPAADTAKFDDALAAFRKEASMTRQERIRRDVLEAMELTQEAINAMPPAQQKEVEEKIAAEVARRMQLVQGGGSEPRATPPV